MGGPRRDCTAATRRAVEAFRRHGFLISFPLVDDELTVPYEPDEDDDGDFPSELYEVLDSLTLDGVESAYKIQRISISSLSTPSIPSWLQSKARRMRQRATPWCSSMIATAIGGWCAS